MFISACFGPPTPSHTIHNASDVRMSSRLHLSHYGVEPFYGMKNEILRIVERRVGGCWV